MRREKPGRESVADAEKFRYLLLPPANVQKLRIGEAHPDPYSSDEETEYSSLDEPIETGVLSARTNRSKLTPHQRYHTRYGFYKASKLLQLIETRSGPLERLALKRSPRGIWDKFLTGDKADDSASERRESKGVMRHRMD